MQIEKNRVVSFHYRLLDELGEQLETSRDGDPMVYLHGHRGLLVGLEDEMAGKQAGDNFSVTLPPEKAYGQRKDNATQRVPLKHLTLNGRPIKKKLLPGVVVQVNTEHGPRDVTVVKAGKFNVEVDTNHPFAGKPLTFEVEVTDVREASAEEISHGHVHGAGGHHH